LTALFCFLSRESTRRIQERDDGFAEAGRHLHEAQRFAIPLGIRHTEPAVLAAFGVAAFLMADQHHGLILATVP